MLTSIFDAVMERRADRLIEQVREWLPGRGPVLDLGSGTGHLAARLERELGVEVVTADVSDMHVTGRPPVLIADGVLPFEDDTFSAALLLFVLAYPSDPAAALAEAARVTRGSIILVQSLHSTRFGHAWLRVREFLWTIVAFHVSKLIGYVPPEAKFTMHTLLLHARDARARRGDGRPADPVAARAAGAAGSSARDRRVHAGAR